MPWMLSRAPVGLCCWPTYSSSCFGAVVLLLGAAPILHLALLVGWLLLAAGLVRRLYRRLLDWADARLLLTDELVEPWWAIAPWWRSSQRRSNRRARTEVWQSTVASRAALDSEMARLSSFLPRGWLVLGCGGARPELCNRHSAKHAVGGQPGRRLAGVLGSSSRGHGDRGQVLAAAFLGWRRTQPLFEAASETPEAGESVPVLPTEVDEAMRRPAWVAGGPRRQLQLPRADSSRCCVAAASRSGGTSTFCSKDHRARASRPWARFSVGCASRRAACCCWADSTITACGPSAGASATGRRAAGHENHILSASLLFNIAMARRWPPRSEDEQVRSRLSCRELGCPDLIAAHAGRAATNGGGQWLAAFARRAQPRVA